MQPRQLRLLRHTYLVLTLLYLAFIAAASFYLTRELPGVDTAIDRLLRVSLRSLRPTFHNLRDIATNVLLYLPLGVLVCISNSIGRRIRAVSAWLLLGLAISTLAEITQAFIGRFADPVDIISNAGGYAVGYLIAWWAVYRIGLQPAVLLGYSSNLQEHRNPTLVGLRFGYVAVALIVALLPLDLSVSLSQVLSQLNELGRSGMPRLILDPFYHVREGHSTLHWLLLRLLVVIPFAVLTTLLSDRSQANVAARVAHRCLLFSATLEFCKLFVMSAYSDVAVVMMAPITGFVVARALLFRGGLADQPARSVPWSLAVTGYLLFLIILSWSPFQFEWSGRLILDKFFNSNLIPFKLHFSARSMASALDIVKEAGLYIPLAVMLSRWLHELTGAARRTVGLLSIAAGMAFAGLMELSQLLVVGRYVDITDPLLAGLGCLIGLGLVPLLSGPPPANRPKQN